MVTLKELCLKNIIQNFDKHVITYSSSEDLSVKRNYEFLKRFSLEIIQTLHEETSVHEDYLDFLANKYLKTLDTDWLEGVSWNIIVKMIEKVGPNLETLYLNEDDNERQWENIFCYLSHLKVIDIHVCTDEYLDNISKFCSKIECISLGPSSNISLTGFKHLCKKNDGLNVCPLLREIKLCDSDTFEEEDIKYLIQNLTSLEKINYRMLPDILYSIHKNNTGNLQDETPYNLTHLDMLTYMIDSFDDTLKICVSLCPHLKTFSCPVQKLEHLNLCAKMEELQNLSLICNNDSPMKLNDFLKVKGKNLVTLKLSNFSVSVAHLGQTCSRLETLELNNIIFQNNDIKVPMFTKLKSLAFKNIGLDDSSMISEAVTSLLASSPNIQFLTFKNCSLFSCDIKTGILKRCENSAVKHISFANSAVEFKFINDLLVNCSSLETLNLESTTVAANFEEMEELEVIAISLSNRPELLYHDEPNFSDYDDFLQYEDDYISDVDYDYNDYHDFDDYIYYDDEDDEFVPDYYDMYP